MKVYKKSVHNKFNLLWTDVFIFSWMYILSKIKKGQIRSNFTQYSVLYDRWVSFFGQLCSACSQNTSHKKSHVEIIIYSTIVSMNKKIVGRKLKIRRKTVLSKEFVGEAFCTQVIQNGQKKTFGLSFFRWFTRRAW